MHFANALKCMFSCLLQLKNSIEEFDSDGSLEKVIISHDWTFAEVWEQFKLVLTSHADTLARTANVVHTLGNVTVSIGPQKFFFFFLKKSLCVNLSS